MDTTGSVGSALKTIGAAFLAQVAGAVDSFEATFDRRLDTSSLSAHESFESFRSLLESLRRLEHAGNHVLLVLDSFDGWGCYSEVHGILSEMLRCTERLCVLLGSRDRAAPSFSGFKTGFHELHPLAPRDAARLFMARVDRYLYWRDLWATKEEWLEKGLNKHDAIQIRQAAQLLGHAAVDLETLIREGGVPVLVDDAHRDAVLDDLASTPLLQEFCQGIPSRIRYAAECVDDNLWCLADLCAVLMQNKRLSESVGSHAAATPTGHA